MKRFNKYSCIVCQCHSADEVRTFVGYCNTFLDPGHKRDPEVYVGAMFGSPNSTSNCIRYSRGDMGHCYKAYYLENGYEVYDFADLDFEEFGLTDCAIEYENSALASFITML